jgi:predicted nicotinamide N-methyase
MTTPRDPWPQGRFVRRNTAIERPSLVPEVALHLASEVTPLWQLTEAELSATGLAPPYWAFAWAGGQALARYLLDNPGLVAGRNVLDLGSGSGLVAIAAKRRGAAHVTAADIDAFAVAAIRLNAWLNRVHVTATGADLLGGPLDGWPVICAADIWYEGPTARQAEARLRAAAGKGQLVLVGDPGRHHLPKQGLEELATYQVKVSRELEDCSIACTRVWRLLP